MDDFERGAEVATHFDIAELDTVVGFHDSNLQSLCAEGIKPGENQNAFLGAVRQWEMDARTRKKNGV